MGAQRQRMCCKGQTGYTAILLQSYSQDHARAGTELFY